MSLRWWERHHTPFFFEWVWMLLMFLAFAGGMGAGILLAFWTLAARGLM